MERQYALREKAREHDVKLILEGSADLKPRATDAPECHPLTNLQSEMQYWERLHSFNRRMHAERSTLRHSRHLADWGRGVCGRDQEMSGVLAAKWRKQLLSDMSSQRLRRAQFHEKHHDGSRHSRQ
jgi:hypothetical protein